MDMLQKNIREEIAKENRPASLRYHNLSHPSVHIKLWRAMTPDKSTLYDVLELLSLCLRKDKKATENGTKASATHLFTGSERLIMMRARYEEQV